MIQNELEVLKKNANEYYRNKLLIASSVKIFMKNIGFLL